MSCLPQEEIHVCLEDEVTILCLMEGEATSSSLTTIIIMMMILLKNYVIYNISQFYTLSLSPSLSHQTDCTLLQNLLRVPVFVYV